MKCFTTNDGRILTPPKELEPLLKGAFPAFSMLLGHMRWFYMADEIWDGKSSLIFSAGGGQLAAVTLDNGVFHMHITDKYFHIADESLLNDVFAVLKKTVPSAYCRPFEQLTAKPNPNGYICGYRCDMCLGYQSYNEIQISGSDNFAYIDWVCYNNCIPEKIDERPPASEKGKGVFRCSGCNLDRNQFCRSYTCSKEKGYTDCAECGDYHSCDVYRDSHNAGQCNLGITAEEVAKLVIPYCMKERLDILRKKRKANEVFSRCGNRCDLCLIYRPNVEKEDRRAEICAAWDKLGSNKYNPSTVICDGCMADNEDAVLFSNGDCKSRKCVIEKGLLHCGYCMDYPCDNFPAEPDAEKFHKEMEDRGVNWTSEDDMLMEPYNPKRFMDEWRKNRV